jgi:hypothetical protein
VSLLLGLFDRPADAGCLKALWKVPAIPDLTEPLVGTSEAHRNLAFTRLQDAKRRCHVAIGLAVSDPQP